MTLTLTDESQFRLLRLLEQNPEVSQREIAQELGISLGKTNYCVKALMEKGMVKARSFRNSRHKVAYMYRLTPEGIRRKAWMTVRFLEYKQREYEELKLEIAELQREAKALQSVPPEAE